MDRTSTIQRTTAETDIRVALNVDGRGDASVATGLPFFDHMLTLWAVHGFFDLEVQARGDIEVDGHHTVEDVGICLGRAMREALGDFHGLRRFGHAVVPMEDALARATVDFCRRPYLRFRAKFPAPTVGGFDLELVEEFLRALAVNAGLTLHVEVPYGGNGHHMAEAVFKALGRAMDQGTGLDPRLKGPLSSKGTL
ncbi:imidazoleglycerol-phosphate dehydratase HisB [Dissulfurirhabdus thermomarina]|uniref:Imidazoleglycerol-phosphate dehydratase n=1 Tax=Dissulfurirhabdus thermomarina TaxID=1765737 RepID=A0A6N9TTD5_DISTH|nr:imidazoleglycerol-phosphate dehydratase HisB [Dissulfurirhabdus thermomarina]NDY41756.1 imidazoleglycerol-phosphate dehydratase HisB [Dissulfurirhabdus thermomarina]NMX24033.1 imidazoleglycerol-phosphate dehydratase HisB [Dissulfurirhabdus thermomarina]